MTEFDVTLVPQGKGLRYFVRDGASTKLNRGFRSAAEVDAWMRDMNTRGLLYWRCGGCFRISGWEKELYIVNRKGEIQ